jgi:hypothetical protein
VQIIGAIVVIIAIAILQFKREESETLPRSEQQRPSP